MTKTNFLFIYKNDKYLLWKVNGQRFALLSMSPAHTNSHSVTNKWHSPKPSQRHQAQCAPLGCGPTCCLGAPAFPQSLPAPSKVGPTWVSFSNYFSIFIIISVLGLMWLLGSEPSDHITDPELTFDFFEQPGVRHVMPSLRKIKISKV